MSFRYSPTQRFLKRVYRKFFPVPTSPWTAGYVSDICEVNLVPPETLKNFFASCIQRLRALKGSEIGDYLEFGVFNGSSMSSMVLTATKLGLTQTKFYGFDAFQGLPASAEKEDAGVWQKGYYACSFEQMQECLKRRKVDPEQIHWVKGWYDQTLKLETAHRLNLSRLGIAFIDCDTYSSSKLVLDFLAPLLTEPAILCFDDWKLYDLDIKGEGEYRSFNEFLENHPNLQAEEIPSYNRKSKSFLIKPR